jgi:Flp pilus assembly protein TadD
MYNLAVLLEEKKDLVGAEQWYREAIKADPKYADAMNNLAVLLAVEFGKVVEAEKYARAATKADPKNPQRYLLLAAILNAQGKKAEAIDSAKQAKKLGVKVHPVYDLLGLKDEEQ